MMPSAVYPRVAAFAPAARSRRLLARNRSRTYTGPVARGIADDDEGALIGFAGSMRANCCPAQLGFAGACVAPSGIPTQGSFSAHQICMLGASQLGSSSVPALTNTMAPYAAPWL